MRNVSSLTVLLALFSGALGAQTSVGEAAHPNSIVGRWDAVTRSLGGIGVSMTFTPDGSMSIVTGAMVDFSYELNGSTLTMRYQTDQPMIATISFAGDTLVQIAGAETKRMIRALGSPSGTGIVGRWTYMHPTGVPAFVEYTTDGVMRLRVPLQTEAGTYTVSGDKLMLKVGTPAVGEKTLPFHLSGDKLTIDPAGESREFLRVH